MRQETVNVYEFDELSPDIQQAVIEKRRNSADFPDWEWWYWVYEDAKAIGKLMGIDIDNIYFSGFWSQGDGACFEGNFHYKAGCVKEVKAYAPQDTELHRIAKEWSKIQRPLFYKVNGTVKHSGYYNHEYCTQINLYADGDLGDRYIEIGIDHKTEDAFSDVLRSFMRWIYSQLEAEYIHITSDDHIREDLSANSDEFLSDGTPHYVLDGCEVETA